LRLYPNRADLDGPYARFRQAHPHAPTFEFYAGEVVPEGIVVILCCRAATASPFCPVAGSSWYIYTTRT
jgi:hypothetical protein